ncbi:hypothetical protein IID24_04055 [Patescibacteria group bacterium]|nr:hypothetical protein [Patescibacteria group bacterium]
MDKFWIVWNKDTPMPTKKYISEDSACEAARKLAISRTGVHFDVMESLGHYVKGEICWEDHK